MPESKRNSAAGTERGAAADFVDFLAKRLGVSRSEAFDVLCDWLARYVPAKPREIHKGTEPRRQRAAGADRSAA